MYDSGSNNGISTEIVPRGSKEIDSLPMPAVMGANSQQDSSWNINQKLVELLQYLNPLVYARLAQSLIQSMLESLGSSNVSNFNTRLTNDREQGQASSLAAAVPADALAIDFSYMSDTSREQAEGNARNKDAGGKQLITVSPEFEYLPDLDLGPASDNVAGIKCATADGPSNNPKHDTVLQMSPIPELAPEQAITDSSAMPKIESADKEGTKAKFALAGIQPNTMPSTEQAVSEFKDESADDTTGAKKGKRKKNKKSKGKSK
ncbi:hypothetical protein LPJ81_000588 [Coemansia sp. IMI 209127]|nr:hypothetical protein LPJ81_000588 [Coemansia sp. IMI 209127]